MHFFCFVYKFNPFNQMLHIGNWWSVSWWWRFEYNEQGLLVMDIDIAFSTSQVTCCLIKAIAYSISSASHDKVRGPLLESPNSSFSDNFIVKIILRKRKPFLFCRVHNKMDLLSCWWCATTARVVKLEKFWSREKKSSFICFMDW